MLTMPLAGHQTIDLEIVDMLGIEQTIMHANGENFE